MGVEEAFNYPAEPEDAGTARAAWYDIQIRRQVYNHAITQEYKPAPEYDGPSYTEI